MLRYMGWVEAADLILKGLNGAMTSKSSGRVSTCWRVMLSAMESFDSDAGAGFAFGDFAPGAAVDFLRAEEILRDFVSPVAETAFGELHDVPLVNDRDASWRLNLMA